MNTEIHVRTPIALYLEILHWSPNDLAEILRINKRTVFRWMNGQNETPKNLLVWLRKLVEFHIALGLPQDWLSSENHQG